MLNLKMSAFNKTYSGLIVGSLERPNAPYSRRWQSFETTTKMSDLLNKTIYNPITSERITFLETSKETQGKRSLLEIEVGPKGKGPPLHFHKRFTEEFTMVKGQMKLQLGKRIVTLNEGESCKIDKELLHTFWSESNDPVCFHGKLEPASKDFENGITIMFIV